ncbi:hypothetical protein EV174_004745, partial [Coemansia sp. RSA 2320]
YLSLLLGYNLYNKAIGGSTSDNSHSTLIDILNIHIPSTQDQINFFKFTNPLYVLDSTRSKDIAMLEVGSNDFFADQIALKNGTLTANQFIDTLSSTVVGQLEQLRKIGFKNIVVSNLAAIQHTPMATNEGIVDMATGVVTQYNQQLSAKVTAWAAKATGVSSVLLADIGNFVAVTIKSAAITSALGLTDTTHSCVTSSATDFSLKKLISTILGTQGNDGCSNPGAHYFMDDVHPAEKIQRLFGYFSYASITAAQQGSSYALSEANILSLISKYNLGTTAPKPAKI